MSPASNSRVAKRISLMPVLLRDIEEHPVVGIMLGVPEHHAGASSRVPGAAAENGEVARHSR